MGCSEISKKFALSDIILSAALLGAGYGIEFGASLKSKTPNFPSFIDQKEKSAILSYRFVCIFTYVVCPFLIVILWLISKVSISIFKFLSTYLFSVSLTCFLVSIFKYCCERPLPDTLRVCDSVHTDVCSHYLQGYDLFAQFTSFPNRAAADTMVIGVFLALFLADTWRSDTMFSAVFKFVPICWAVYMGAIEIITRRANPDDVIAGEMIGAFVSYFAFRSMKTGMLLDDTKDGYHKTSSVIPVNIYT
jgi:membrane-associated phospholipid phosphatase